VSRALCSALILCASTVAGAEGPPKTVGTPGKVDWQRRVLVGSGTAAPDLNAPSIAVARRGAEKLARNLAVEGALEALRAAELLSGGPAAALLLENPGLSAQVEAALRAQPPLRERFFVDGGIALTLELSLEALPPALLKSLKPLGRGTAVVDPLDPSHLLADPGIIADALRALTPQEEGAVLSSEVFRQQGSLSLGLRLRRPNKPDASVVLKGKSPAMLQAALEKALPKLFQ